MNFVYVVHSNRITKDPNNPDLMYCQRISSTPATRLDVINLQEQLDMRLQQRQARETGICPVRRELFSQCFGKTILHEPIQTIKSPLSSQMN